MSDVVVIGDEVEVVEVGDDTVEVVTVGVQGPAGPTGATGAAGSVGGVLRISDDGTQTQYLPASDTDTARGTAYATALAAAASGDVLRVGPGVYNVGSQAFPAIPAGVAVVGSGRLATVLTTNASGSCGFALGTGAYLADLSVNSPNGDAILTTGVTATGVVIEGVDVTVGNTGVACNLTTDCSYSLRSVRFFSASNYLLGCRASSGGALLRLVDCIWLATHTPNAAFGEISCSAGAVEIYGGAVRSAAATQIKQTGGTIRVGGLDFDATKTSGTIYAVPAAHDGTNGYVESLAGELRLRAPANQYVRVIGGATSNGNPILIVEDRTGMTHLAILRSGVVNCATGVGMGSDWAVLSGPESRFQQAGTITWTGTGSYAAGTDVGLSRAAAKVLRLSDTAGGGASLASPANNPAQLTGNTNNWDSGVGGFTRFSASGAVNVTGIVASQDGEYREYHNTGSATVTFKHEDAGSTAANRIHSKTGADLACPADGVLCLRYDSATARWRARLG